MDNKNKKIDIGGGIGVGLGFALAGIFTLKVHFFFGIEPIMVQIILGLLVSAIGVGGMLIEMSKKEGKRFFADIGIVTILFVPIFATFLMIQIIWLKVLFAVLVNLSLIFVGLAFGRSVLTEDGSFRINMKAFPRFFIALLSTIAVIVSAISTLMEKIPSLLKIFGN